LARIPEDLIRSVLDAVDIVDVVSVYVTLKRSGSSHKGLCPFHDEKTPSFHVFPNSGRFKCFGCGEGGDAVGFLMKKNSLGFVDALEELAREKGIELPKEEQGPEDLQRQQRRGRAASALEFAARFFRAVYDREAGEAARGYMAGRGFLDGTIERFSVGFAPDEFEGLLGYATAKGHSAEALFDAGLIRRSERGKPFDMFRGRIMFPIHDLRGHVIGFGARALGDVQPKYLNSPDGALFHKGSELYGMSLARPAALRAGRLIVVEGYTDVMACHQAGVEEVAAGLGTALTSENARQLRRFNLPVVLLYDGDDAGRRAAERAADVFLAERVEGSVALLPSGRDPADLVSKGGPEALEEIIEQARDLWHYRVERALERHDVTSLEGRSRAAEELVAVVPTIGDALRRDAALKLLSEQLGLPESTLRDRIERDRRPPRGGPAPAARSQSTAWRRAELDLIAAVVQDPAFWDRVEEVYPPEDFSDPELGRIAHAIRNLRRSGQSVARESLLGDLADDSGAVQALQAMEFEEEAKDRAEKHLETIADRNRRRLALHKDENPLEAMVRARGGTFVDNEDS